MVLEIPLRESNIGRKNISFMGPPIWNKFSNDLKTLNTPTLYHYQFATSFTHNYIKLVLQNLSQ